MHSRVILQCVTAAGTWLTKEAQKGPLGGGEPVEKPLLVPNEVIEEGM